MKTRGRSGRTIGGGNESRQKEGVIKKIKEQGEGEDQVEG